MKWLQYLWWLVRAVALLAVIACLLIYPGNISLEWLGYHLETPLAVFFLLGLLLITIGKGLLSFGKTIFALPHCWLAVHQKRSRAKAEKALVECFVTTAAGRLDDAGSLAQFAMKNLPDQPLAVVAAAQIALLQGNHQEAQPLFSKLQQWPEVRFLGVRGEALQAMQIGNWFSAQKILHQAVLLQPNSPWALQYLFEAEVRLTNYERGQQVLEQLYSHKVLDKAKFLRRQAILNWLRACKDKGNRTAYGHFLQKAYEQAPEITAIAGEWAKYTLDNDQPSRVQKILRAAWQAQPHPQILALLAEALGKQMTPLALYRHLEEWSSSLLHNPETQLLLAEAAVQAELWGQARQHLKACHNSITYDSQRACQLMAAIEQDETLAKEWLDKALQAGPNPTWICAACYGLLGEWAAFCGHCGAFDSLHWGWPVNPAAVPDAYLQGTALRNRFSSLLVN